METNKRRVISLLVDNQSGVLARVSNLFCRRGFNIDSLTVSATNDAAVSRITVTITSDEKALQQLILQTERLEVTRQVFVLDGEKSLERELLLLKVASDVHNRSELREIASIYKAKIIDLSPDSMVFELIGKPDKIDAFLKMFADYKILEQCRTGVTALERGGMHQHMLVVFLDSHGSCSPFCFVFIQWLILNILFFRSLRAEKRSFNPLSHLALLDASSPEGGAFIIPSLLMMHKTSPFGRGCTAQP